MNRRWSSLGKKYRIFVLGAILFWFLSCMIVTPVYTTVTLEFAEDPRGEVITTIYAGPRQHVRPSDARSRVVNSGTARISFLDVRYGTHCSLKRIDPLDQSYTEGTLTVERLTVRQNGFLTIDLTGEELRECFTGNEHVQFTDETGFTFAVTGEDPQLLPKESFCS